MGAFGGYTDVLLILKDHGGDVDLSNAWTVIEHEETIPQSIKVTLSANFGEFLTRGTKIQKFDRLYFEYTGRDGNVVKDVFHVREFKRSRKPGKMKQLTLICPHQSENLWKRTVSLVGKRTSGFQALNLVMAQLNEPTNKGSLDPTVEVVSTFDTVNKLGNNLDPTTNNNYIFEAIKLEEVLNEISDIESQPIEGGGSFEFPFIRFKSKYDHSTGNFLDVVQLQAYAQGFKDNASSFTNVPSVTLTHEASPTSTATNTLQNDSAEIPERATNIIIRGNTVAGDYLGDFVKFQGAKDVFNSAKQWLTATPYQVGSLVFEVGVTYESKTIHTSSGGNQPPNATNWVVRTFVIPSTWVTSTSYTIHDLVKQDKIAYKALQSHTSSGSNQPPDTDFWRRVSFPPTVNYSPETKQKAQYWVNALAGAKHAATNNGQTQMIDPNVIIIDTLHPRTYVRYVNSNPTLIPSDLLINGNIPDAFRMLAINPATGVATGAGDFAGNDRNGIAHAGNINEFIDPDLDGTGEWVVFKASAANQDQEVFDWFEGEPWINKPCEGALSFVNAAGVCTLGSRNANWVKGSYALTDIPFVGKFGRFISNRQFECAHSVKWDSGNSRVDMGNKKIIEDDTDSNSAVFVKSAPTLTPGGIDQNPFYVGFNFWSTVPVTSNAIPFGAVTAGEVISLPTFDFNNMFRTPQGNSEWFGPNVETYFPIQSYNMWLQLIVTQPLIGTFDTDGDFKVGIWMADRRDNTRIIELNQERNVTVFPQEGKLPGKPYRGVPGASQFFSASEPDTTDGFDPREFVVGGIYTRESFDTQGRYIGLRSRFVFKNEMEMALDGFRRVKPLVATNVDIPTSKPTRNIETQRLKKESIDSYAQLKNLVLGLERIFNFERQEFDYDASGRLKVDIKHGDPVYITDTEMIDETTDSLPNTLKVVVNKITRTFTRPKSGPGGVIENYNLVTRIWP